MPATEIKPGIYWIGVNDRSTDLFEGIWPIDGTGISYNSYLIVDEKKVLVDLAKSAQEGAFLDQLSDVLAPDQLDYIVINHMEPDHTGVIKVLKQLAPQATILGSAKTVGMLKDFFGITEGVRAVADGEELVLGEKTIQFFSTPFVHWPETIMTYEQTQKVLFTCDAFGGYGALRGAIFDDTYDQIDDYVQESLRYYTNIVSRFSGPVIKAIDKVGGLAIDIIAPSHGLVWRKDPMQIVNLYRKWAELASAAGDPGVTLVFGSMYGNTEKLMNAVAEGVARTGLPLQIFDCARTHDSYVLPYAWIYSGILIGAPTYEVSLYPPMVGTLHTLAAKRVMNKKAAYFGSFGWSGGAKRETMALTEKLNWTWVDTMEVQGAPTHDDLCRAQDFGEAFARSLLQG